MGGIDGESHADIIMKFHPTMELRYVEFGDYNPYIDGHEKTLQQKWTNELGENQWRDIPSVTKK